MTPDRPATRRDRARRSRACARVRARAVGLLVRRPRELRQRARRTARGLREPLLRRRLHEVPEALRHRRTSSSAAQPGRSRPSSAGLGGHGRPRAPGAVPLPDRVRLDASALLGARPPDPPRLRSSRSTDAPRRSGRAPDRDLDRPLHDRPDRRHPAPLRDRASSAGSTSAAALALGLGFLGLALRLLRETTPARARRVFTFSLSYLALLFVAMAIDPIIL